MMGGGGLRREVNSIKKSKKIGGTKGVGGPVIIVLIHFMKKSSLIS